MEKWLVKKNSRIFTIAQAINSLAFIGEIFPSTVKEAGLAFSIGLARIAAIIGLWL